jgi:hypothetical protein
MLPAMAALAGLYLALHSPLRNLAARRLGFAGHQCYLSCWGAVGSARVSAALAAATLIGAALIAAAMLARRASVAGYERPLAFGLLGFGFLTIPAALVGAIGSLLGWAPLRPPLGPLLVALPALVTTFALRRRGSPVLGALRFSNIPAGLPRFLAALAGLLILASALLAISHPPTGYDALAYHAPLAVYLWREGNLTGFMDRMGVDLAYAHPASAELWFGALRLAGGEMMANLGQLPFALLGGLAVYAVARRSGLRPGGAAVGGCAFLLAPIVVAQAGVQLNDLASGALVMTAAAIVVAPTEAWNAERAALAGLGLGLAAATKLSMLPEVAVIGGAVLVLGRARPSHRVLLGLTFLLAVAPWWGRNLARFGNPIYPAAIPFVGRGYVIADYGSKDHRFVPSAAAWPIYPLIEPHSDQSGSGALFVAAALPGLLVAAAGARRRRRPAMALYAAVAAVSLPVWWRLTQHEPRFLLPVVGLAFGYAGWALAAIPRAHRRAGALLLGATAAISALVTLDQALGPLAAQPSGRAEFYDAVWGIDPEAVRLPEGEGLLYQMGRSTLSYAGDYPLLGPGVSRALVPVDADVSPDSVVRLMRRSGIRWAYVPAAADARGRVEAVYRPELFDLVHASTVDSGSLRGTWRYLYRLRVADPTGALQ